jgi:hypothetical protein
MWFVLMMSVVKFCIMYKRDGTVQKLIKKSRMTWDFILKFEPSFKQQISFLQSRSKNYVSSLDKGRCLMRTVNCCWLKSFGSEDLFSGTKWLFCNASHSRVFLELVNWLYKILTSLQVSILFTRFYVYPVLRYQLHEHITQLSSS